MPADEVRPLDELRSLADLIHDRRLRDALESAADEIVRLRVQVVRLKVEIEDLRAAGESLYVASHAGFSDRLNDAKLAWRELRR